MPMSQKSFYCFKMGSNFDGLSYFPLLKKYFSTVIIELGCSFYFSTLKFFWLLKIRINALHKTLQSSQIHLLFTCFSSTCAVLIFLSTLSVRDGWLVSGIFWPRLKGLKRHEQTRLINIVKSHITATSSLLYAIAP